ncbi:Vgb family protein, partial [Streptomyces flavofungini]|uniref:Vgb family protein n=1 Tax=Streptomyces flavofungini TaxID=68200 RepID=UPI0034DE1BB0
PTPGDLQESVDGGVWYTAGDQIGRLDPSGTFTWWSDSAAAPGNGPDAGKGGPGFPDALALGPDDAIWFEHADRGSTVISRADTKRGLVPVKRFRTPFSVGADGMALGPDGAVWFTQRNEGGAARREGIGRLTADGDHKRWPLPRTAAPGGLVAGPDKALWFTDRRAVGRVGTDGEVSRFPVRGSRDPRDIVLGHDKALWFTADNRVGRITTRGRMTLWPVRGARDLSDIVPVKDGTFWLSDPGSDTVRRFTPK